MDQITYVFDGGRSGVGFILERMLDIADLMRFFAVSLRMARRLWAQKHCRIASYAGREI